MNFSDLFALSYLVNVKTCTKSECATSLDMCLQKNQDVSIILVSL